MTVPCCIAARICIPAAAVRPSPLQHLQMTSRCCKTARPCIPVAAVRPRPLEHLQMTSLCCVAARPYIPAAAVRPSPLQHRQMTSRCCSAARLFIPVAAVGPSPLKRLECTDCCQTPACIGIPITHPPGGFVTKAPHPRQPPSARRRAGHTGHDALSCVRFPRWPHCVPRLCEHRVAERCAYERGAQRIVPVDALENQRERPTRVE